jgi:hypothetical protein
MTIGPVTLPYDAFRSTVGGSLSRITSADRMVALRYIGSDLTASVLLPPFDQTGAVQPLMGALADNPHTALDVRVQPAVTAMRLGTTSPAGVNLGMDWSVTAAPGWELLDGSGVRLALGSVATTDTGMITTGYGNPFTLLGWRSLFMWATYKSRTFTVPAYNLPTTLYTGLNQLAEPTPGVILDHPVGLPVLVSINQIPLTTDGATITLDPAKSVELSVAVDRTSNTFYELNVHELVPNAAMQRMDYFRVYSALGTETSITIPNDVFVPGHTYMIRAECAAGGYPSFAAGNFRDRSLPFSLGYLDSGVFTVAAP